MEVLAPEMEALEVRLKDAGGPALEPLTGLLTLMFGSGGKRMRPALVFAACRFGDPDADAVTNLGAAVETLHAATLVHDDLVDGSSMRRGLPTVNASWSAGATVLAGDWLFARAARFAASTWNVRVMDIFARTLQTLTDGELRQLLGRRAAPSVEEYERRIYAKTAALFEASCEMGAVLAERSDEMIQDIAKFGCHLGMAFQIVDDILDFTGDAARLGKPVGNDLRTGTVTLPVLLHLARNGRAWPSEGVDDVDALVAAVAADEAALQGAWRAARSRVDLATAALEGLPAGEGRELLAGIARHAVDRDA